MTCLRPAAFLAVVVLIAAACQSGPQAIVSPAGGPVVGAWSEPIHGLRTRIAATSAEFRVGEPLSLQLEIENTSAAAVEYSAQQVAVNEPFLVTGPDGERVGWVGITRQTASGGMPRIEAGKRRVLVAGYDLTAEYLICEPGVYTIESRRHRGFPNWPLGAIPGIPGSLPIRIDVAPGDAPKSLRLMAEIHRRLPRTGNWRLSPDRSNDGGVQAMRCHFTPPGNRKGTSTSAVVGFRAEAPEPLGAKAPHGGDGDSSYLGPYGSVHAYVETTATIRQAWPAIVDDLRAAVRALQ